MTRIDEQINDSLDLFDANYINNIPPVAMKRAVGIVMHQHIIHRSLQNMLEDYNGLVITARTVNAH